MLDTSVSHIYNQLVLTPGDPGFSNPQTTALSVPRFDSSLGILRNIINRTFITYNDVTDVQVTAYAVSSGTTNYALDMRHRAITNAPHLGVTSNSVSFTTLIDRVPQQLSPGQFRRHNIDFNLPNPITVPVRSTEANRIPANLYDPAILQTFTTDHDPANWDYELTYNPGVGGS